MRQTRPPTPLRTHRVIDQPARVGKVVGQAVVTAVAHAHIAGYHLQKPERQGVLGLVQHVLVEHQVALHAVRPQAVGARHLVHGAAGRGDALVHLLELAGGLRQWNHLDPGSHVGEREWWLWVVQCRPQSAMGRAECASCSRGLTPRPSPARPPDARCGSG